MTEATSFPPPSNQRFPQSSLFFTATPPTPSKTEDFGNWKTVSKDCFLGIMEQNRIKILIHETASALVFPDQPPEVFQCLKTR